MTLECAYPSVGSLTQMEWFKVGAAEKESMAIFNPTYGMVIRTPYAGKVSFLNATADLDDTTLLSFRNASEADVGLYSCVLESFPQGAWEKTVRVVPSGKYGPGLPSYPPAACGSVPRGPRSGYGTRRCVFATFSNSVPGFREYGLKETVLGMHPVSLRVPASLRGRSAPPTPV